MNCLIVIHNKGALKFSLKIVKIFNWGNSLWYLNSTPLLKISEATCLTRPFQLSQFLFVVVFHLCDVGLKFTEGIIVCHGHRRRRVGIFWGWLSPKARACANHECKWSRGKFYRSPTVDAKCTYQHLEQTNVGVDIVKMGSSISHVRFIDVLHLGNMREDIQNERLWRSSKYMSKLRMNQKER